MQIPSCMAENIVEFDSRVMAMNENEEAKMLDKMKRDLMRRVLTSVVYSICILNLKYLVKG